MDLLIHASGQSMRVETCEGCATEISIDGVPYSWAYTTHFDVFLDPGWKLLGFSIGVDEDQRYPTLKAFAQSHGGTVHGGAIQFNFAPTSTAVLDEIQGFCEVYECPSLETYAFFIHSIDLWNPYEFAFEIGANV